MGPADSGRMHSIDTRVLLVLLLLLWRLLIWVRSATTSARYLLWRHWLPLRRILLVLLLLGWRLLIKVRPRRTAPVREPPRRKGLVVSALSASGSTRISTTCRVPRTPWTCSARGAPTHIKPATERTVYPVPVPP